MVMILEFISVVIAYLFTIGLFTLLFDGKNAFKRNK